MNAGQLCAYIDRSWDLRDATARNLADRMPALQERAHLATSMALQLLPPVEREGAA
jgi:hypothetical protein